MMVEQEFEKHLLNIKPEYWNRLFALLPEIETIQKFGEVKGGNGLENGSIQMPYSSRSKIVNDFFNIFHDLKLSVVFDWGSWAAGKNILNQKDFNFNKLDTSTLCKLLTTIVRADRFNDGFLVLNFENGIVPKIIKAIKQNETKRQC